MKSRLSAQLDRWVEDQGDPRAEMDTREVHQAARKGTHLYYPN